MTDEEPSRHSLPRPDVRYGYCRTSRDTIALTGKFRFGWMAGFALSFLVTMVLFTAIGYLFLRGVGIWGSQCPDRLGIRDRQFCLVDWYRTRGNPDICDSVAAETGLADIHQSLRRGDDAVCGRLRRDVSDPAPRPSVALLLAVAVSEHNALWPQPRSPLIWDVFAVSTYATVSLLFWYVGLIPDVAALRDRATSQSAEIRLRHNGAWLARLNASLGALRDGLSAAGRACDTACRFGSHRRQLRLWRSQSCPDGTRRSFRPISSQARSIPASRWCSRSMIPLRRYYHL